MSNNDKVISFFTQVKARNNASKKEIQETIDLLQARDPAKPTKELYPIPEKETAKSQIYELVATVFANHPEDLLTDENAIVITEFEKKLENTKTPARKHKK